MHASGIKKSNQMIPDFHKITQKYHISSDKRPRCLFNVEVLRGGAYYRAVIKRGISLFQKKVIHMKFEKCLVVTFQINVNNNLYDI